MSPFLVQWKSHVDCVLCSLHICTCWVDGGIVVSIVMRSSSSRSLVRRRINKSSLPPGNMKKKSPPQTFMDPELRLKGSQPPLQYIASQCKLGVRWMLLLWTLTLQPHCQQSPKRNVLSFIFMHKRPSSSPSPPLMPSSLWQCFCPRNRVNYAIYIFTTDRVYFLRDEHEEQ